MIEILIADEAIRGHPQDRRAHRRDDVPAYFARGAGAVGIVGGGGSSTTAGASATPPLCATCWSPLSNGLFGLSGSLSTLVHVHHAPLHIEDLHGEVGEQDERNPYAGVVHSEALKVCDE